MKLYEHLELELTYAAIERLEAALTMYPCDMPESVAVELRNVANECRARLQHALADARAAREAEPTDEELLS